MSEPLFYFFRSLKIKPRNIYIVSYILAADWQPAIDE